MSIATINNLHITDYRNRAMKQNKNNAFNIGDIFRRRSNGYIQYYYVKSFVNSGLNLIDLNIDSKLIRLFLEL